MLVSREVCDESHHLTVLGQTVLYDVKYYQAHRHSGDWSQTELQHFTDICGVRLGTLEHKSPSKSSRPLSGVTTVWTVGLLGV